MRRALIVTLATLVCAVLICAGSLRALNATVDAAQRLQGLAAQAAGDGDLETAGAMLSELETFWRGRTVLMELLASHDNLHEIDTAIADAAICLALNDVGELLRALSSVDMGLQRLADEEAVKWENLY